MRDLKSIIRSLRRALINLLVERNFLYILINRIKTDRIAKKIKETKKERGEKIVLSFTTIGWRIGFIEKTVRAFFDQGLPADEVCLVISDAPYLGDPKRGVRKDEIPEYIRRLEADGKIRIIFTENIGPYKKIIPILKEYYNDPNVLIITGDDDTIYPYDWVLNLYRGYLERPDSIIAYRCRHIQLTGAHMEPYRKWEIIRPGLDSRRVENSDPLNILPTGKGGVLYRARLFPELVFDKAFLDLCPFNDDLWIRLMTILNKVPVHIVRSSFSYYSGLLRDTAAHDISPLKEINFGGTGVNNDTQLSDIMDFLSKRGLLRIINGHFIVS